MFRSISGSISSRSSSIRVRIVILIIRIFLVSTDDGGSIGIEHFIVFIGTLGYTKDRSTTFGDAGILDTVVLGVHIVKIGITR